MKAMVLLNRNAGSLLGPAGEQLQVRIREGLQTRNIEVEIVLCADAEIAACAKKAAEEKATMLVAGGGDGTLNAIVNATAPWSIPLGILPLGTLNHFAKDVGIPQDLDGALDVIAQNNTQMVDIAEVNGRYFLNNSSIGLYPKIVQHRERQQEVLGRGKWHAMLLSCIHVLREFPLVSVSVKAEGSTRVFTTAFVFIGNNDYKMNLLALGKRERLDRGELSIYLAKCNTRRNLLRMGCKLLLHRLTQEEDFTLLHVEDATITTMRPSLNVALDGEIHRLPMPLQYEIHKKALPVLLPVSTV